MLGEMLERLRGLAAGADPEAEEKVLPIAAATLLLEVAWADHEITPKELATIRSALSRTFALDDVTIEAIIEESRAHHNESVGLYRFTRTITEAWTEPQRFELVVSLWRLALADGVLDGFEEHMIRKIAELLYVSHPRFIEAKLKARAALGR
jgi:uncharacterized tellurite resistance protein B-like protein